MTRPEFIYFDMGNVLIYFSHQKMAEQMAQAGDIPPQLAWQILFDGKNALQWAYERGELNRELFYQRFCEAVRTTADIDALDMAGSDIFAINAPMCGLASQLAAAGYRLAVCSNTTPSHWRHCVDRYHVLSTAFVAHALSFQIGAMKPDPAFYLAATKLAAASPSRIFFVDDRPDNVAAAKTAGWDAVLYESASQTNQALRERGVVTNY
jgi:putative hydrolase of the HAD superfamily